MKPRYVFLTIPLKLPKLPICYLVNSNTNGYSSIDDQDMTVANHFAYCGTSIIFESNLTGM